MLENYFPRETSEIQKQRLIAVNTALELIKATLADANDGQSIEHQLRAATASIAPLADAIQQALEV